MRGRKTKTETKRIRRLKKETKKAKPKKPKKVSKLVAVLLAYLGSNICVFLLQILGTKLPLWALFIFQLLYGFVLYHKFKKMELSNNTEIKGKL
jgi:Flp pilus assembly protein TadB